MRFNDRNYAILGIPDLPINAFKHIGDRKIKPQGGFSSFVSSIGDAVSGAVSGVSDVLADVDDTVNESIPGGWGTVAAVAGGAALLSGAGTGAAATTGGAAATPAIVAPAVSAPVAAGTVAGTGLSLGGSGLGLSAGGGGLGLTAGSAGASSIGAGIGSTLAGITTGVGAGAALGSLGSGVGSTIGSMPAANYSLTGAPSSLGIMDSLAKYGSGVLDFAKANPSLAGSLLGALGGAIGAADAPTSQTATTSIDPQIKAEYLANLERAKTTAAGLEARQIAQPGAMYTGAEQQLYNLGMTPFGAADIERFFNPYQEQVVQGALGDIERTRQMQEQENMARATAARAFGGSRQGVVSGMTNEAALRQAATTGAQLRSAGFNTAANLGLAARPMDIAGLQTSLGLGTTRTALEQARLDALRNLGTERLAITGGALGLQPANVGQTSTQPLYTSQTGSLLSGGLTGAYIGSLLGKA
jgi:hypothetical protein